MTNGAFDSCVKNNQHTPLHGRTYMFARLPK